MKLKNSITDYTESEFFDLMKEIYKENIAETDEQLDIKPQSILMVPI